MSAVLDQTETTSDPWAGITAEMLTTPDDEPVRASATPEPEPASAEAATDQEATPTGRERDQSGRFAPKAESEPAPEGGADTPPVEAKATEPEPNWREVAEKAARELAAVRGNVDNAAKQAREQARQEALEEATRNQRETIRQQLAEYEAAGHDVTQARKEWAQSWKAEDDAKREQVQQSERAGLMLTEVQTDSEQKLLTLYHHGATVLAEDTGLPVEDVRAYWADPEDRERFKRAVMQSRMAEKLPGAGFNREALNDYMASVVTGLKQVAVVRQQFQAQLAEKDKQIARLTQELNRDQTDSPALRPEQPSRGGGQRRASTPDERATQVLTDNSAELARAFGLTG